MALQAATRGSAELWDVGPAVPDLEPGVEAGPANLASHSATRSSQQVGTSSKCDVATGCSQASPGLTHTAPRLHEKGGVPSGHAASVGSANARGAADLEVDAAMMQETLQGRLWAATAESDTLAASQAEHTTLRAFVHRIQAHLSCDGLEELEAKVHRMSAPAAAVAVDTAVGPSPACNAATPCMEPTTDSAAVGEQDQGSSERRAAVEIARQSTEQLALKTALEAERAGRLSECALQVQQLHELREQLQQAELRLQGLAEVQEMTAAELKEARAERDAALATNCAPVPDQPRTSLADQGTCTDAHMFSLKVDQGVGTDAQVHALTVDRGTATDVVSPQQTAAALETEDTRVVSVLHVAEPPPLQMAQRLSPSKAAHQDPGSFQVPGVQAAPQQGTGKDARLAATEQSDVAGQSTEVFEERVRVLCAERDVAASRIAELEREAEELRQRCAVLKSRAEDSERALREGWPAVKQEVENVTEKCRLAPHDVLCNAWCMTALSALEYQKPDCFASSTYVYSLLHVDFVPVALMNNLVRWCEQPMLSLPSLGRSSGAGRQSLR